MNEKKIADALIKRHKTNCPFTLAEALNINVFFMPLGTINGYYTTALNSKFIYINSELAEHRQRFTMAHELGHAILHPKANTPFLRDKTLFSVDKLECEANRFAVSLIITDANLVECAEFSKSQIAALFGVPEKMLNLRI